MKDKTNNDKAASTSVPDDLRLLFSKRETAKILGVSTRTVERLYYERALRGTRVRGLVRFHRKAIEAFARRDHA